MRPLEANISSSGIERGHRGCQECCPRHETRRYSLIAFADPIDPLGRTPWLVGWLVGQSVGYRHNPITQGRRSSLPTHFTR